MQDVRSYKGYDRDYSEAMNMQDFIRANYYNGDMDPGELIEHIAYVWPKALVLFLQGVELEEIVAEAMTIA